VASTVLGLRFHRCEREFRLYETTLDLIQGLRNRFLASGKTDVLVGSLLKILLVNLAALYRKLGELLRVAFLIWTL
jgi:hypothetical protein